MRNIGKSRLCVNYLFSQDVVSVCSGGATVIMLKGTRSRRLSDMVQIFVICRDSKCIFDPFLTGSSHTPLVHDSLCLGISIPGIIGVLIEVIVIDSRLK